MNENLDLTKILKGCPDGTKFYSSVFGIVSFYGISNSGEYFIKLNAFNKYTGSALIIYYTKDGRDRCDYDGECTLFPSKDQRDWSKFERFWDKPKTEKFDPNTLQPFDKVLVRDNPLSKWRPEFFGFLVQHGKYTICAGSFWYQCIPYNDDTKHLVGTKEDCPEFYKWWKDS